MVHVDLCSRQNESISCQSYWNERVVLNLSGLEVDII